jgi:hypothetical protein
VLICVNVCSFLLFVILQVLWLPPLVVMEQGNIVYDFWCAVVRKDTVSLGKTGKKLSFRDERTRWGWARDVN